VEVLGQLVAESGSGAIVTLGRRVSDSADLAALNGPFAGRRVVNVDIHAGPNVDVVGDVHQLSRLVPPRSFAAAYSESLLEHVVAPWLVAAEINRVLTLGALVLHVAPTVWPEHASPNDFWRFTADGLAVLFGPATGFEVIEKGAASAGVRIHPDPAWRGEHLDMPTLPASDQCWVLARKVRDLDPKAVSWPYDPVEGERVAREYPIEGIRRW
jgi:hypothetical protein